MPKKKAKPDYIKCAHQILCDPVTLTPNPRNPNTHDDRQIEILAKVINHTGFRAPIVISRRSEFVVKGHGRLLASLKLGLDLVPVDVQDYASEAEEHADMIADNRIAELSVINDETLVDLVRELEEDIDFDATLTGFDQKEIEKLLAELEDEDVGGEDIEEKFEVIAECKSEAHQRKVFHLLEKEGVKCRLSTL